MKFNVIFLMSMLLAICNHTESAPVDNPLTLLTVEVNSGRIDLWKQFFTSMLHLFEALSEGNETASIQEHLTTNSSDNATPAVEGSPDPEGSPSPTLSVEYTSPMGDEFTALADEGFDGEKQRIDNWVFDRKCH